MSDSRADSAVAVGIDVGSFSTVSSSALLKKDLILASAVELDVNAVSNRSTPSVIAFDNNVTIHVGESADGREGSLPFQSFNYLPALLYASVSGKQELENVRNRFRTLWPAAEARSDDDGDADSTRFGGFVFGSNDEDAVVSLSAQELMAVYIARQLSFSKLATAIGGVRSIAVGIPDVISGDESTNEMIAAFRMASELTSSSDEASNRVVAFRVSECLLASYTHKETKNLKRELNRANKSGQPFSRKILFVDVGFSQTTAFVGEVSSYKNDGDDGANAGNCRLVAKVLPESIAASSAISNPSPTASIVDLLDSLFTVVNKKANFKLSSFWSAVSATATSASIPPPSFYRTSHRLRSSVQKLLHDLSMLPSATFNFDGVIATGDSAGDEFEFSFDVSRQEFETAARPILSCLSVVVSSSIRNGPSDFKEEIKEIIASLLSSSDAAMNINATAKVQVVGGGSRIPCVQTAIIEGIVASVGFDSQNSSSLLPVLGRGLDGSSAVSTGACLLAAAAAAAEAYGSEKKRLVVDGAFAFEPLTSTPLTLESDSISESNDSIEKIRRLMAVHENEQRRLALKNRIESSIYEIRNYLSSATDRLLFDDVDDLEKFINNSCDAWFEESVVAVDRDAENRIKEINSRLVSKRLRGCGGYMLPEVVGADDEDRNYYFVAESVLAEKLEEMEKVIRENHGKRFFAAREQKAAKTSADLE
jgi:hypothetical protein